LALLSLSSPARAGGLDFDGAGARAIARAGTVTVSDDSTAALAHNPAGLARRAVRRAQVGIALHDHDIEYAAAQTGSLPVQTRDAPTSSPMIGYAIGWERVVAGIVYLESGDYSAITDEPRDELYQADIGVVSDRFPHRYAGTALTVQRRTVAAGGAMRVTPWLALGVSIAASRVTVGEAMTVWAGFSGIDTGFPPTRDMRLSADGTDAFVLGAHAGALVVPESVPFELAFAATYTDSARADGTARLRSPQPTPYPAATINTSDAGLTLPYPLVLRTGGRYLGPRFNVEVDADLSLYLDDARARSWDLDLEVQSSDALPPVAFTSARSAIDLRDHYAVRGAVDVEIVRDFVWLSAGYAFHSRVSRPAHTNPVFAGMASHTFGVGAEGYWRELTISVGYARTLSSAADVTSVRPLVNPVAGGTELTGSGHYDRTADAFGIAVEIAWDDYDGDLLASPLPLPGGGASSASTQAP
jgi:long-subunit fatty acid transport protein